VRRQKRFQSALQKFQRFTGSLRAGTLNLGSVMREGRCCDRGNFPRTRLSCSRLSWSKLAKARSGLVPTFQRREKKLAVSFGLYNIPRLLDVAQESRLLPSGDVDVNHCVTIEDDFGFVTKEFIKPTAEGRQFHKWEISPPANGKISKISKFPKDGQRIAVIGTNKIVKLTVTRTKWHCCGTIQRRMAL